MKQGMSNNNSQEQSRQVRHSPKILELAVVRDELHRKIVAEFGVVKMAEGEAIYHVRLQRFGANAQQCHTSRGAGIAEADPGGV
jgi:hypothetical protein